MKLDEFKNRLINSVREMEETYGMSAESTEETIKKIESEKTVQGMFDCFRWECNLTDDDIAIDFLLRTIID